MRLLYKGRDLSDCIGGLDKVKITIEKGEDGRNMTIGTDGNLTFYREAFDLLKEKAFCIRTAKVSFVLFDECCGNYYPMDFEGKNDSIKWDLGNCKVESSLNGSADIRTQLRCLRSALVFDEDFKKLNHPQLPTCFSPNFLTHLLLALYSGIRWILLTFPGSAALDDKILEAITNCNHCLPSPFLKKIIENGLDKCGLEFCSTILKDAGGPTGDTYHNLVYAYTPSEKPVKEGTYFEVNCPIQTTSQFLNDLKKQFPKTDYKIIDGCLHFERLDYFWNNSNCIGKLEDFSDKLTYSQGNDSNFAFGNFAYCEDSSDTEANRMAGWIATDNPDGALYDDIIEWNPNGSECADSGLTFTTPFGRSRFGFGGKHEFDEDLDPDNSGSTPFSTLRPPDHLLVEKGTMDKPKLILLRDEQSCELFYELGANPKIARPYKIPRGDGTWNWYNTPMYFREKPLPDDTSGKGSLYSNFGFLCDPRFLKYCTPNPVTFTYDCDLIEEILKDNCISVDSEVGKFMVCKITVDPSKQEITFSDFEQIREDI